MGLGRPGLKDWFAARGGKLFYRPFSFLDPSLNRLDLDGGIKDFAVKKVESILIFNSHNVSFKLRPAYLSPYISR